MTRPAPRRQRAVELRDAGLSVPEIAAQMGVSRTTARHYFAVAERRDACEARAAAIAEMHWAMKARLLGRLGR